MSNNISYEQRGVSAHKEDVVRAVSHLDPGVFPGAFCKAVPDVFTGSPDHCVLLHADGAGTKSSLAYLHYKRHGDPTVFHGIAQDSLVMNLDDMLCVGALGPYVLSNTIGRNAKLIPGEVIQAIVAGYELVSRGLEAFGFRITACGGETADVGDLVRTLIVDSSVATRMERSAFINAKHVKAGHVIVGLASFGQATYEYRPNSGIGTNGFTALRHSLLSPQHRDDHPESFAPEIYEMAYTGAFDLDDPLPGTSFTVGEACLSPTRTYAPVIAQVLAQQRDAVSALFHNTGGGQTKCLNFGGNVRYVKDNLFAPAPLFRFIRDTTGNPLREMLRVFNMGHRMEVVCEPSAAEGVIEIAQSFGIEAQVVGRVEPFEGKELIVETQGETVEFRPH